MWARLKQSRLSAEVPRTHAGVLGQVWRGGVGRQAMLSRALKAVQVVALDERLAKQAGLLLARNGSPDIVDAAVVALARTGDQIVTSDPEDIDALSVVASIHIDVVPV